MMSAHRVKIIKVKYPPPKKNRRGLCAAPGRMRPIFPNSIERHPGICHGETKFYLSKQAAPFIGDIQIGHGDDALSWQHVYKSEWAANRGAITTEGLSGLPSRVQCSHSRVLSFTRNGEKWEHSMQVEITRREAISYNVKLICSLYI